MRFTLPQIRKAALYISVLILTFAAGWYANASFTGGVGPLSKISRKVNIDRTTPTQYSDIDFSLFWRVWDKLESDYYDQSKINEQEMILGAIKGMVSALGDPYTSFLPPEEQKRTQEDLSGKFEGVGIEIGFRGSRLTVISPLEGSPAEKGGVRAGDFIVGIKDTKKGIESGTGGMTLLDAVDAIRGPADSKVTLILTREGVEKPLEIEITRAKIEVPSVVIAFVGEGNDIAHLKLKRFGGNTEAEWNQAIAQVQTKKPRAIILDLRNNPGGYLPTSVDIASDFLTSGVAVIQESAATGRREMTVSGRPRVPQETEMVILINGGSASASEIVAGALKDHKRAQLIGGKTFGKGTIQEARPVNGNSGLHITVAKWLTPNGTWVHEKGLEPDVAIEDKADTEEDEQLSKAIELLK